MGLNLARQRVDETKKKMTEWKKNLDMNRTVD